MSSHSQNHTHLKTCMHAYIIYTNAYTPNTHIHKSTYTCLYVHTYFYMPICTHKSKNTHEYMHIPIHGEYMQLHNPHTAHNVHTYYYQMHIYTHLYMHAHAHVCTHKTYLHIHAYACTHIYIHPTCVHKHTHQHAHTHIGTHRSL